MPPEIQTSQYQTRNSALSKNPAQQHFYESLQKNQTTMEDSNADYYANGLLKLGSDMSFTEAKNLIHNHIMDLDI